MALIAQRMRSPICPPTPAIAIAPIRVTTRTTTPRYSVAVTPLSRQLYEYVGGGGGRVARSSRSRSTAVPDAAPAASATTGISTPSIPTASHDTAKPYAIPASGTVSAASR
ncbi:hypothetical protein SMICM17S_00358 [Streptomyces microflavus]